MKVGDLVRNKNSESGELGLFVGMRTFKSNNPVYPNGYDCAEVYWQDRGDVGTIQTNLIEVINESR